MKKLRFVFAISLILFTHSVVYSWDSYNAHPQIVYDALDYLKNNGVLSTAEVLNILDDLGRGTIHEDGDPLIDFRSWFHFLGDGTNYSYNLNSWYAVGSCDSIQWGFNDFIPECVAYSITPPYYETFRNDYRWQNAIDINNPERWYALGHILHLLADMAIPAHTRNDPHVFWNIEKYAEAHLSDRRLPSTWPTSSLKDFNQPKDYLRDLANFTRTHFFSDDTVFDNPIPTPIWEDSNYFYTLVEVAPGASIDRRIAHKSFLYRYVTRNLEDCTLDDYVLRDEFDTLYPKVVFYVASLIKHYYDLVQPPPPPQGIISLPKTGQTTCYDQWGNVINCAGTGQDGEIQVGVAWPDPRFAVGGDCVTDNLTGLMWAKDGNLPNGTKTWQGALDFVASINAGAGLCGYNDWRLPNVNELESLVNAGEANTATWLNAQGFTDVQSDHYYWSSTTFAYFSSYAWTVGIWAVDLYGGPKSDYNYVWPVRSGQLGNPDPLYPANIWKTGQTTSYASGDDGDLERGVAWPSPRFTDHGDGTVTDNLTGLMWTKNANPGDGTKTWQEALDYVKTLNIGSYSDWRLPNRKELFSLTDRSRYNPALPANHPFQNIPSDYYYYWSSTTVAYVPDIIKCAWEVLMWSGHVYAMYKSNDNYVWPVRGGYLSIH